MLTRHLNDTRTLVMEAQELLGDTALHMALQALLDDVHHVQPKKASSTSSNVSAGGAAEHARDALQPIKRAKRQRKDRVPTYYLRKSEKISLELQLQLLNAQAATLKSEQQARGPLASDTRTRQLRNNALEGINQARNETDALRDAVQSQQLSFARVQSAFGAAVTARHDVPFQTYIRLGKDWDERHETLLAMKDFKMQSALQYIAERSQCLDRSVAMAETSRFMSSVGDFCTLRFDVVPFEGIHSVQQVFEALMYYGLNMEISISEMLGDITIREDDGVRQQGGILQNRFVSSVREDIQVETNTVMICQLHEAVEGFGGGREFATLVADFVDEDELFPFQPSTRLRHDVTAALTITLEPRKFVNALGEKQEELIAVMTRTALLRLHQSDLPIPPYVMLELRTRIEGWSDAMTKTVRGILYPEASQTTNLYAHSQVNQRLLEA